MIWISLTVEDVLDTEERASVQMLVEKENIRVSCCLGNLWKVSKDGKQGFVALRLT